LRGSKPAIRPTWRPLGPIPDPGSAHDRRPASGRRDRAASGQTSRQCDGVILNGNAVASKGRTLRAWNTLSELINSIKGFENNIYGTFGGSDNVLVELNRIAHRQFIWQSNAPNSALTIRYFRIFNRPMIDKICQDRIGLNIWQLYMCGVACMGLLFTHPAVGIPFKCEIKALTVEMIDKFFTFTSKPLSDLKVLVKDGQQYNENYAYAFNSLRAVPLVRMSYQGRDSYVCPLMTLLYWR
jgi:hypothetical protein